MNQKELIKAVRANYPVNATENYFSAGMGDFVVMVLDKGDAVKYNGIHLHHIIVIDLYVNKIFTTDNLESIKNKKIRNSVDCYGRYDIESREMLAGMLYNHLRIIRGNKFIK